jgi:hypothetical protein
MNCTRSILLIFFVLAMNFPAPMRGQNHAVIHTGTGTSGTITAGVITGGGDGNLVLGSDGGWVSANGASFTIVNHSGISWTQETRKLDNKGPTIEQVKLSAALLDKNHLPPAGYLKLARHIGLDGPAYDEARVLQAIDELGLTVYNAEKVDNYLYREALKKNVRTRWVWKPLRAKDLKAISEDVGWQQNIYRKQYAHAVPERVLASVNRILERLPEAMFLISDFEYIKPDPFLAITTPKLLGENKLWIVEQWDEPGFGADPEPTKTRPINATTPDSQLISETRPQ